MGISHTDPMDFRSKDECETWRRIYHETAHAVVAIRLGATVRSADILGGKDGQVDMDKPDKGTKEENAFHRMVIKIASFPGEECLSGGRTVDQWRQNAGGGYFFDGVQNGSGDWPEFCQSARDYCRAKGHDVPSTANKEEDYNSYFQASYQEAKKIVEGSRDAVEKIGQHLYNHGKIEADTLNQIMNDFPPKDEPSAPVEAAEAV